MDLFDINAFYDLIVITPNSKKQKSDPAPPPSCIFGDAIIQCAPFTHKALLQQQAEAARLKRREPRLPFISKKPPNSGSSAAREMFYTG